MIYTLLEAIANILRANLLDTDASHQVILGVASEIPPKTMPCAVLYPTELAFNGQQQAGEILPPGTVMREFQHGLLIDIYATRYAEAERWASLTTNLVLTSQAALLEYYNLTKPTQYATPNVRSVHRLDHIHLLQARPILTLKYHQWQLQFKLTGHMIFSHVHPETAHHIQEILLAVKAPA